MGEQLVYELDENQMEIVYSKQGKITSLSAEIEDLAMQKELIRRDMFDFIRQEIPELKGKLFLINFVKNKVYVERNMTETEIDVEEKYVKYLKGNF